MNIYSPVLVWGITGIVIIIVLIIIIVLFSAIGNTKQVEAEKLSHANKFERRRKCPDDRAEMIKEIINEIVIDKCPRCGGIFLDKDELEAIKNKSSAGSTNITYLITFFITLFGTKA